MTLRLLKRTLLNKGALWLSYIKLFPILRKLNKSSIVFDCGANVGDITKKFAETGAQVYAFEPDEVAYSVLEKRFRLTENVTLIKKGVWDKNTEISLYSHKDQSKNEAAYTVSSSIVSNKLNVDNAKSKFVEVIDLTEFIENLGKRITVIKLDVEGAEIEILKKIIDKDSYKLFDMMYVETHETKIPGHLEELVLIKKLLREKNILNIKLNWL
ncbi:MAG: FkbM family methyltransferase [Bacteroidota bacterium]|nr:FkbM family methyltransferase [Bacteroidota bacterium]